MKTRNKKHIWLALFVLSTSVFFVHCTKDDDTAKTSYFKVDNNGNSRFNGNALNNQLASLPLEDLSEEEESALLFMREEEKLAHDVYVQMFEKWSLPVFSNIAASEQTHTDAVLLLVDRYGLVDPVGSNGVGLFTNSTLQQLYDDLTLAGLENEIEALRVGATIEEIDILDLVNQLDTVIDNQDIKLVFENLRKGSRNHLRAYIKNLKSRGFIYKPQYLSQQTYDEIINGEMERGQ